MRRRHIGGGLALPKTLLLAALLGAGVEGCAEGRPLAAGSFEPQSIEVTIPEPELGVAEMALTPLEARRAGSTIALATTPLVPDTRLAIVADEDARAVRVRNAANHEPIVDARLDGTPSQLVIAGDGRLYVALRDRNEVIALELTRAGEDSGTQIGEGGETALVLEEKNRISTATEPVALAVMPDRNTVIVTSGWAATIAGFAVPRGEPTFSAKLEREPRGVTVSRNGRFAYVAHAIGSQLSKVELGRGEATPEQVALGGTDFHNEGFGFAMGIPADIPFGIGFLGDDDGLGIRGVGGAGRFNRPRFNHESFVATERNAVQGFAVAALDNDVFVPQVLVHRGESKTGGYGTSQSFPAHQPALVHLREGEATRLRVMHKAFDAAGSRHGHSGGDRPDGCLLPRSVAVDPQRDSVLVSCLGTDEVVAYNQQGGALTTSSRGRWKVPAGPMGIAVDSDGGTALVWSQFARTLSEIDLPEPHADTTLKLRYPSKPDKAKRVTELGKMAHEKEQPYLSASAERGRTIFHGAGDARIANDGRACASCHPDGREDGLTWPTPNGPRQTPMLAGRLHEDTAPFGWQGDTETIHAHVKQTFKRMGGMGVKGDDLDDLIAYCKEMATPTRMDAQRVAKDQANVVARGAELFRSESVGCAVCHTASGKGSDGARHGVGSGPELETPSLRFIAGTAPYFHDGRYATLSDMLRDTKGKMGWGTHLKPDDLAAIEAFLMTL